MSPITHLRGIVDSIQNMHFICCANTFLLRNKCWLFMYTCLSSWALFRWCPLKRRIRPLARAAEWLVATASVAAPVEAAITLAPWLRPTPPWWTPPSPPPPLPPRPVSPSTLPYSREHICRSTTLTDSSSYPILLKTLLLIPE